MENKLKKIYRNTAKRLFIEGKVNLYLIPCDSELDSDLKFKITAMQDRSEKEFEEIVNVFYSKACNKNTGLRVAFYVEQDNQDKQKKEKKEKKEKKNLQSSHSDIIPEWHPTKNGKLTPSDVTKSSNKKVWWLCNKGHEWQDTVKNRYYFKKRCPYCHKFKRGIIDLATYSPDIAAEWHPTKNRGLTPADVTRGSKKRVWWLCSKGHEYYATPYYKCYDKGVCPYCELDLRFQAEEEFDKGF